MLCNIKMSLISCSKKKSTANKTSLIQKDFKFHNKYVYLFSTYPYFLIILYVIKTHNCQWKFTINFICDKYITV